MTLALTIDEAIRAIRERLGKLSSAKNFIENSADVTREQMDALRLYIRARARGKRDFLVAPFIRNDGSPDFRTVTIIDNRTWRQYGRCWCFEHYQILTEHAHSKPIRNDDAWAQAELHHQAELSFDERDRRREEFELRMWERNLRARRLT